MLLLMILEKRLIPCVMTSFQLALQIRKTEGYFVVGGGAMKVMCNSLLACKSASCECSDDVRQGCVLNPTLFSLLLLLCVYIYIYIQTKKK